MIALSLLIATRTDIFLVDELPESLAVFCESFLKHVQSSVVMVSDCYLFSFR